MPDILTFADICAAAARIAAQISHTPVMRCTPLEAELGAEVFCKCENFQEMGAFKIRGAANAVLSLSTAAAARGVATHSSGNHGAALALAARRRGIPACVVMPENSSAFKKRAVAEYGAKIIYCESSMRGRETALQNYVAQSGATIVHPYNDPLVMAGQGTAALELHEEVPGLEWVLAPVGGGGLLSGTAVATRALRPGCKILGVEPLGADDAWRSLRAGHIEPVAHPDTVADGLRATIGPLTFEVLRTQVDEIVRVAEPAIVAAMRFVWERLKIIIEPSAAVVLAALRERLVEVKGRRVGVILSGGNVDLDHLPW
ncbi:MAG: pyridoxal-phosphate dependent enzyme [Gammaproteobacteria bacterium]|nr:pyridoxal-phosphate dependent enzyme [Gammaproteobacteria bacterium]MBU6508590.1 pyridoxal-phosphate dependent enzyme [Gammaproteobacteria bacterium]MDE1983077.1 pyridoxal-phosphate dependent enzyme [Gammaproteobacteria bacterium]MDE2107566.1 pyridoxal-phosphate dependent enzyme [Gammaproteobacteria bacterium]MDE2459867.1 pyridoxal-phosphate dependent enzyme [Gammaproteobacteria bacterium]